MTDTPPTTISAKKPRPPLRVFYPVIGVALILAAYTTYWFVASDKLQAGIKSFVTESKSDNIAIAWNDLSVSGYPYRIALIFAKPVVAAPKTPENWSWSANSLESDFLPYNLRHLVLKVDGEQELHYSDVGEHPRHHIIRAHAEGTWASYVALKDKPFGRVAIDIKNIKATRDSKDAKTAADDASVEFLNAGRLQLHMQPAEDNDDSAAPVPVPSGTNNYDIALQGNDMSLSPNNISRVLGDHIEVIAAQARLRHVPYGRSASLVELSRDWLEKGGRLTVSDLIIKWGALDLWAQGELTLDAEARPKGRFNAEITNYASLLEALVKAGIIREKDARLANVGMGLVAQLQGKSDGRISVPVVMNNGKLYLGPLFISKLDPVY